MSTRHTLVPFKGTTALRAPDGALMQLPPNSSLDTINKELHQRAQKRKAPAPDLSIQGHAPQIFTAVTKALEQTTTSQPKSEPKIINQATPLVLYAMQSLEDEKKSDDLLSQGKAVLRIHREADVLWVHPLADPLDTQAVRAQDVRNRRMALSPAPEIMRQILQREGFDALDNLPEPAVLLASAQILKSVSQWMHQAVNQEYSSAHPPYIFRIEMGSLRVSSHPIIRVPQVEPLVTS